jgi:hypothetical protein
MFYFMARIVLQGMVDLSFCVRRMSGKDVSIEELGCEIFAIQL